MQKSRSSEEVKKAYFDLIRKHSPEKDPEGFKRIRLAYESLRDLDKRSQTDIFMFNDPYGEFIIVDPGEYKIEKEIDLEFAIYALSDLGQIDFSNDFTDIED